MLPQGICRPDRRLDSRDGHWEPGGVNAFALGTGHLRDLANLLRRGVADAEIRKAEGQPHAAAEVLNLPDGRARPSFQNQLDEDAEGHDLAMHFAPG